MIRRIHQIKTADHFWKNRYSLAAQSLAEKHGKRVIMNNCIKMGNSPRSRGEYLLGERQNKKN